MAAPLRAFGARLGEVNNDPTWVQSIITHLDEVSIDPRSEKHEIRYLQEYTNSTGPMAAPREPSALTGVKSVTTHLGVVSNDPTWVKSVRIHLGAVSDDPPG